MLTTAVAPSLVGPAKGLTVRLHFRGSGRRTEHDLTEIDLPYFE